MSYDLMVFDPVKAPGDKASFMNWYGEQTKWSEDHSYSDIKVSSESLQRFYEELVLTFPSMNVDDDVFEAMEEAGTDNRLTEYSLGKDVIYAAFAWSVAEEAYTMMRELAKKHNVGFFDVSGSDGEIIRP
ncbi:hypothetical protein JNUCC31_18550 [Paenibacillus sp. JNUCC31]|uniref:hypothetical protein n=1 Tax=Paenibacillus sp. JNUCC-31 TaxID=2777983 RepID=UPI001783E900|nr:hypothetical protein [Paenibacillus sp. JNUCC-31]QOS76837.1 hypothetical protein JNUCC31_18550 [Paenibacillus sp. JNUCC-31]